MADHKPVTAGEVAEAVAIACMMYGIREVGMRGFKGLVADLLKRLGHDRGNPHWQKHLANLMKRALQESTHMVQEDVDDAEKALRSNSSAAT